MKKIAIVGAPSTGKTVLARLIANSLAMLEFEVDNVLEYARTYLFRYIKPMEGRKQDLLDQVMIQLGQKRREDDYKHCDFVICDSATFIPYIFASFHSRDFNDPRDMMVLQKLFKWSMQEVTSYDFIFYLPAEIEYKPKKVPWRVSTQDERAEISRRIENYLLDVKYPYFTVDAGSPEAREKFIMNILTEQLEEIKSKLK